MLRANGFMLSRDMAMGDDFLGSGDEIYRERHILDLLMDFHINQDANISRIRIFSQHNRYSINVDAKREIAFCR